jgi:ATP-binding cassette, subfamily B, bacterial
VTAATRYLGGDGVRGRARSVAIMATAAFRADRWRASLSLALDMVSGLSGPLFAVALGWLAADAAGEAGGPGAGGAALALTLALGIHMALGSLSWQIRVTLEEKTAHLVECHVVELVTGLVGLSHHEQPEHLRRVERLMWENWLVAMSVPALVASAEVVVRLGVTVVLLARVDRALLLLPLFGVPLLFAGGWAERIRLKALDARADAGRRADYLFDLATRPAPAKETRIFGLGPEVLRRHAAEARHLASDERRHRLQGAWLIAAGRLVFALGYTGAVLVVASRAALGQIGIGELVLTVSLASQVMGQLTTMSDRAAWLNWTLTAVRHYVWLLDFAASARRQVAGAGPTGPAPERLHQGLRFEGVAFRYPGTDAEVLSGVDLDLPAGTIVAVVGDNGAGKTTLVKLLCRFHEPTEGRITVDGVDLRAIDAASWRRRTTAAFRDPTRYGVLVQEAVGVGDVGRMDRPSVEAAIDGTGVADVVAAQPLGLSTQLGPDWEGGIDLSGGQWQKLALARSAMPEHPLLLVLDEPTAALDAEAEHAVFERYARAAQAARATTGAVTVLVSHRFSTVRMADRIVVVSGGRVAESGSHDELMVAGGLYAELFTLQSRAYR